ncbi:MAG: hypothetical protein ABJC63_08260 [Gemmatimonadales bacterium]
MPSKSNVPQDFQFEDGGQTFHCTVEAPRHAGMAPWWWFRVESAEKSTRHAPFEASPKDTKQSVQKRVIAYYAELLAIAARPVRPAYQRTWQKPARPADGAAAAPVAGGAVATEAPIAEPAS